jgi:hypothetical protein
MEPERSWSTIVTIGCLAVVAFIEAFEQALAGAPTIKASLPSVGGWVHYIPLALLLAAGVSWLIGRFSTSGRGKEQTQALDSFSERKALAVDDEKRVLALSVGLGECLVYRQELKFSLLSVCAGTSLPEATVFLQVKTWAKTALNITKLVTQITIDHKSYEGEPINDLSDWVLREDIIDEHQRKSRRDTQLGPQLSLITEIETGIFREGHHGPKWVGYKLPLSFISDDQIKVIKMTFHDKNGIVSKDTIRTWPKTSHQVIAGRYRRPA